MGKIIDKILERRRQRQANNSSSSSSSASAASLSYYSFEFFPPKTEAGLDNLLVRLDRMVERLNPLYVDVTWGSAGATAVQSMAVASHAQKYLGVDVLLHLTTQGATYADLRRVLSQAKVLGIGNVLVLRGDPPRGQAAWRPLEVSGGDCPRAIDLVKLIKQEFASFGIAVAGHPEGHPSSLSADEELQHLKDKIEAGADFVVTQFFYDTDKFLDYVQRCRAAGITCPIIPGIMPIQSYTSFVRMTEFCNVSVPESIRERLLPVKDDDKAIKDIGCELAVEMCQRILTESNQEVDGVHFYTMNLERSVTRILVQMGVVDSILEPVVTTEATDTTTEDPKRPRSGSLSETPIRARAGRVLPWRPSAMDGRSQQELIRPINWANRPKSYVQRTDEWDEFPNGRWGDATSPAFGEWSHVGHFFASHASMWSPDERRAALGYAPSCEQDVWQTFVQYIQGQIPYLPWCETTHLQPESQVIAPDLVTLNQLGFLTINSQPAVNGLPSDDAVFGWGGANGYIYQKAYIECFCSPRHLQVLRNMVRGNPHLNLYAVTCDGRDTVQDGATDTSGGSGVTALTWGVFPNREIVQPTVFDPSTFVCVWAEEAFSLWTTLWLTLYTEESDSYRVIQEIRDTYVLCAIVDNDYMNSHLLTEMVRAAEQMS